MENDIEGHSIMLDACLTSTHRALIELEMRKMATIGQGMGADTNHGGFSKSIWSHYGLGTQGWVKH